MQGKNNNKQVIKCLNIVVCGQSCDFAPHNQ